MKIPILLMVCVLGSAHGLPTFRELYASAKSAIGFKSEESATTEIPLRISDEEIRTSKYSLHAVMDKAKSYIPSASSLVPKLSYKDGTLSYSWAIFHMSGGVHRQTTPTPETTKLVPEIAEEEILKVESRTISNYIPRSTTEQLESSLEEINTDVLRSTEDYEEQQPREIFWNPRYEIEFPELKPTEAEMVKSPDQNTKDQVLEKLVHSRQVNNEDVDFWKAEYYLGKKLGRPFFKYMMDNDLL